MSLSEPPLKSSSEPFSEPDSEVFSKLSSKSEQTNADHDGPGHINRITVELLRAKARQRKRFVLIALALIAACLLSVGGLAFSNATVVEISPPEARDLAIITVVDGFGATIGHAVYTLSGHTVIDVSAPGFRSVRKTLQAGEIGTRLRLKMAALPGHLLITTHPSAKNTRWFIDGRMAVVGALLNQDVAAGKHSIDINSPYYQQTRITVMPERGKTVRQTVELKPVEGHLNIRTIPSSASIRINGDAVGSSPLNMAKAGGRYQIEVRHDDYQPVTEIIEITHTDHDIERNYRLSLQGGVLHVHATPVGGELLVDGKTTGNHETVPVTALAKHALVYAKQGYFSQHRHVTVAAGAERDVAFHLKPELGRVRIVSKPVAMVNVDGKDVGKTPLSTTLSTLPHRIIIHKQGYRSYRRTITPNSKSQQQIRVRLQSERAARLAESPLIMTNTAGIEMKQFRPHGVFMMGAPRSETGQRANEFLRRVKLTKPFYISTHEVNRAQYGKFKQATGKPVAGAGNEPVTSVSWIEAAQYCNWLSRQAHLTPFYNIRGGRLLGSNTSADGYRLPSEAEWEWLARKAFKTKESRFTWGDDTTIPPRSGNIADEGAKGSVTHYVPNYTDGYAGVAPVGSYPPDKAGLYDLTGNVSEWVHDVYTLVPTGNRSTEIDPMGPVRGDTHTVKGSNWRSGSLTELRASYREGEKAGRNDIGFRVARYVLRE